MRSSSLLRILKSRVTCVDVLQTNIAFRNKSQFLTMTRRFETRLPFDRSHVLTGVFSIWESFPSAG